MPTAVPYANEAFGITYFGDRVGATAWDNATTPNREKALRHATRMIDTLNLVGFKTGGDTQVREFPRNDEATIPLEVQEATCEVALALLNGHTLTSISGAGNAGVTSESIGDASKSYSDDGASQVLSDNLGLPSPEAARLMAPWLHDPYHLELTRVS